MRLVGLSGAIIRTMNGKMRRRMHQRECEAQDDTVFSRHTGVQFFTMEVSHSPATFTETIVNERNICT